MKSPTLPLTLICTYAQHSQACLEAGVDVPPPLTVLRFADMKKWRSTSYAWYAAVNPNEKVPTLCDPQHGVCMWDSCAITAYLGDTYDPHRVFFPATPHERALYHQLAFYLSGTIDNLTATSSPIQVTVEASSSAASPSAPAFLQSLHTNRRAWEELCAPIFERQLESSGGPWLLGARFTAIDAVFTYSLRALHDKMATEGDGSWLDAARMPRLCAYQEAAAQREVRRLVFAQPDAAATLWTADACAKHAITWLNVPQ